jgi:hypothetical protein
VSILILTSFAVIFSDSCADRRHARMMTSV